jgi:hypothetical protein
MTTHLLSHLPSFWTHGTHTADRARPAIARQTAGAAAPGSETGTIAARSWRWAQRQLKRVTAQPEPRNVQEVLAYARSIEHLMPNMATELRFIAQRDADTPQ